MGQEDTTRTKPFTLYADQPQVLLGENQAANPFEFFLHTLAACLTTTMVYHAAAQGIQIDAIESQLEGNLDIQGVLGLSPEVRPGYRNLKVNFTVKSDAPVERLEEFTHYSPVLDMMTNPVPVSISVHSQAKI